MKTRTRTKTLSTLGSLTLVALLTSAALPACGGEEKPAKAPDAEGERAFRTGDDDDGDVGISAEVGGLNQSKARAAFKRAEKKFEKCLIAGLQRMEYLLGEASFFVGINDQGEVVDAYLTQSTLGDRETEKCMLDAIRAEDWPPAVGGQIGEARHGPIGITEGEVRPAMEWTADDIAEKMTELQPEIDKCKGLAGPNRYTATWYVDVTGKVLAAGMSQSQGGGDAAVDCLVGVLKGAEFPSPGSWPAKMTSYDL